MITNPCGLKECNREDCLLNLMGGKRADKAIWECANKDTLPLWVRQHLEIIRLYSIPKAYIQINSETELDKALNAIVSKVFDNMV